ncbi:MAG: glyceraldehyde-3-phosphate dehydrogenase [Saprospiraceae bacterium]|nr:glyceraldehyde-3-phosphate dehydrogenase [Saprospiraceae bacterium]
MTQKVKSPGSLLQAWQDKEKKAMQLLQETAFLKFNKSVDLVLFRNDIYDTAPSQLIHLHDKALNYCDSPLDIELSLDIATVINSIANLSPCKVDIGKMGLRWLDHNRSNNLDSFVNEELQHAKGKAPKNEGAKDIILYGFGRIGRLVARRIIESTGQGNQLILKAIVIRPKLSDTYKEAKKRAALLSSDSVHGDFSGQIIVASDGKSLTINGNVVHLIYATSPSEIDYIKFGIHNAMIIDNTGVWRDDNELSQHLRPGVDSVLLTAPGKGKVPNIVYGVNHNKFDYSKEKILSAASCTTNAIVPVLSVLQNEYGILNGHVETIHAYTNDQNLLDNFHKKERRGRGAPINMVLTSTGAASAVSKVIPELAGKLSGNAIRVPTPNVSMAILNLTLDQSTNRFKLDRLLKNMALHGELVEQLHYSSSTEYVSSNAIGMTTKSVVDAPSTIVSEDGKTAIIYLWYDNEYGYTCQVVRLAKKAAGVNRHVYL